jgi:hypothetical protein
LSVAHVPALSSRTRGRPAIICEPPRLRLISTFRQPRYFAEFGVSIPFAWLILNGTIVSVFC